MATALSMHLIYYYTRSLYSKTRKKSFGLAVHADDGFKEVDC